MRLSFFAGGNTRKLGLAVVKLASDACSRAKGTCETRHPTLSDSLIRPESLLFQLWSHMRNFGFSLIAVRMTPQGLQQ